MVWPIDDLTTAHLDAGTDDPKQARPELLANINKFKAVLGDPAITEVANIAALKALAIPSSVIAVNVQGYTASGDGGGGLFWWDSASSTDDNGGTVIAPDSAPANGRWKRLYSGAANVKWFGAKGDGVTNDSSSLQSALDSGITYLVFSPGNYYCPGTLTVPENVTISGYGARIHDTGTHRLLLDLGSSVAIYGLEVEGAGNGAVNSAATLIRCQGTDNTTSAPIYVTGPTLVDCFLHGSGFYGVLLKYVDHGSIKHCRIENIGYAGVMGLSVSYVRVDGCEIIDVSPGSTNAYGVAFTRMVDADSHNNLIPDPRSSYCAAVNCLIDGVTLWEGLDTHAGDHIMFANNTIKNCRVGIAAVPSHLSSVSDFAPQFCTVSGNIIEASDTHSSISLTGAAGVVGSPTEYSKNCVIIGNSINKGGEADNDLSGSIYVHSTLNLVISGNVIYQPNGYGIQIYHTNRGFSVIGNSITDPHSNSITIPAGIVLRSSHNKGSITGNTILRQNSGLNTNVCVHGLSVRNSTESDIYFDDYYNEALTKVSGVAILKNRPQRQEMGIDSLTTSTSVSNVSQTVTFKRPFSSDPKVILSHDASYIGAKALIAVAQSVSTTGFTIRILTPDNSNFSSAVAVNVSWAAME